MVAVPCLVALTTPFFPTAKGPAELQGAWELVALEGGGRSVKFASRPRWAIVGNAVLYGGRPLARLTADPAAGPKVIDLKFDRDRVYEGVYAVEKDTLRVCLNKDTGSVKNRPAGFSTEGQADWRLLVFERAKAGDAGGPEAGFVGMQLRADAGRGVGWNGGTTCTRRRSRRR